MRSIALAQQFAQRTQKEFGAEQLSAVAVTDLVTSEPRCAIVGRTSDADEHEINPQRNASVDNAQAATSPLKAGRIDHSFERDAE